MGEAHFGGIHWPRRLGRRILPHQHTSPTKRTAVYDLLERQRQASTVGEDGVKIAISSFPVLLRGKSGTLEAFRHALQNASLQGGEGIMPVMPSARPATPQICVWFWPDLQQPQG